MKLLLTRSLKGILAVALGCFVIALFIAIVIYVQVPSREKIRGCIVTEMYQVHLCPGSKEYVPLNKISKHLQEAVVVTEDSAFFDHHGFDFQEIQNSFEKNLAQGRFARGGSTITQQLAKNMFLSADKSLQRKVLEAVITIRLEKVLTKKEILERYLNVVQFGKDLYGVKDAAQFYFKKSPANLDVVESAFLAFLLPSPEKYSVSFFKKQLTPFAKKRLMQISTNLYKYGRIQPGDYRNALGRINSFLAGGASRPVPEGLDLNAPEDIVDGKWQDEEDQFFFEEAPAEVQPPEGSSPAEKKSAEDQADQEESLLESGVHSNDGPSGEDDTQDEQNNEIYQKSRPDLPQAQ